MKAARHRQQQRRAVELQRQHQRSERQNCEQHQCLERRDAPCGQRPVLGARHLRVEAAVRIVIDGAAGGAHQHGSGHENEEDARIGLAAAADPERPQRRPEQQPDADRTVQAHEAGVVMARSPRILGSSCGGPRMKANAIRIPAQRSADPICASSSPEFGQRHVGSLDAAHGGQEQFLDQQRRAAQ